MDQNFIFRGFTDVINVSISEKLKNIQKLIYSNTKKYLVEHENSLSLEEKVNLYFAEITSQKIWSELMKTINDSSELKNFINWHLYKIYVKLLNMNDVEKNNKGLLQKFINLLARIFSIKQKTKKEKESRTDDDIYPMW